MHISFFLLYLQDREISLRLTGDLIEMEIIGVLYNCYAFICCRRSHIQRALKEAVGRLILQPGAPRGSHVSTNNILKFTSPHWSSKLLIILKLQTFLNKKLNCFLIFNFFPCA